MERPTAVQEQRETAHRRQKSRERFSTARRFHNDPRGNHIWLKLPDGWSADTLERAANENGVNLYSAAAFCREHANPKRNSDRIRRRANDSELRIGLNVIARLLKEQTEPSVARY